MPRRSICTALSRTPRAALDASNLATERTLHSAEHALCIDAGANFDGQGHHHFETLPARLDAVAGSGADVCLVSVIAAAWKLPWRIARSVSTQWSAASLAK